MDHQADRIGQVLRELYPKHEVQRVLDAVARRHWTRCEFRTFVWHAMPKQVVEQVQERKWEVVEADLRHRATQSAVLYVMHCVYERAAKGRGELIPDTKRQEDWSWISKAG